MRLVLTLLLIAGVIGGAVYGIGTVRTLYEKDPPVVEWIDPPAALGQSAALRLGGTDEGMGFERVVVTARQKSLEVTLFEEDVPSGPGVEPTLELGRTITFDPRKQKMRDGEVTITVVADDASRRNRGEGNRTELTTTFEIRTRPPNVEILSGQHNVAEGGTQAVAYRLGPSAIESGVQVGELVFPGFPSPVDPTLHVSVFAIPHDAEDGVEPRVFALDELGNRANAGFYHKVLPKSFPDELVNVPDALITKCREEFALDPDLSDAEAFVAVNRKRRAEDHERLAEVLASASESEPLWSGPFERLPNSARMSDFAEQRTYRFRGEVIDHAEHLGLDLASNRNAPVPASADGVVIFAEDLGIYGNTVLLDHGFGVTTLYSHLTSFAVNPGDRVKKGRTVGNTGTTGLALGDHLHFGIYVNGIAVDPIEWWDGTWLRARIDPKLALWREGAPQP